MTIRDNYRKGIQRILDEIAAEPMRGALVFPQIYAGEQEPERMKLLKLGNQYDIMEELKDLSADELKSLIAVIKKR